MAWYHVGSCSCPVGCCDCGPLRTYTHKVEYFNMFYNEWCNMHFESWREASRFCLDNWEEIRKKRLVKKLGRKPKVVKLVEPITE